MLYKPSLNLSAKTYIIFKGKYGKMLRKDTACSAIYELFVLCGRRL